jgi:hypothetical protein
MAEAQRRYRFQFFLFLAALALLVFVAALVTWQNARVARAAERESLAFNHRVHVEAGAQCVFCHPGVLHGPVAGIPSTAKCTGCHVSVQVREAAQPTIDWLIEAWQAETPLQWVKTFDQPDYVYFSHQPHIAAGVACESCHGDVGGMARLEQTIRLNMGYCLRCHRDQAPEKIKRLETCTTCHQ